MSHRKYLNKLINKKQIVKNKFIIYRVRRINSTDYKVKKKKTLY